MHTKKTVQRYFIYLAYDGTAYHGWQIQPNGASVQECLMKALSTLLRREVEVVGAGRTDAGVHASLMVAHFDSDSPLDTVFMTDKLNRLLPPDISVYRLRAVKPDAHARFDATARMYKYYVTTAKMPFNRQYRCRLFQTPDFERMNEAAQTLFDYTDFTSFSKLHTDVKTNICRLILSPGGYLYHAAEDLIGESLRELSVYETILAQIAAGQDKLNDLYRTTGFSRAKISVYMKNLAAFDIIQKVVSFETGGWENTKKGVYRIRDNYVNFWFHFIYPHLSDLYMTRPEEFYDRYIAPGLDAYLSRYFVEVCMEYLGLLGMVGKLPLKIARMGTWVGKEGNIDIIAQNEIRQNMVGLCNWQEPELTMEMCEALFLNMKRAKIGAEYYFLFSAQGFAPEVTAMAERDKRFVLVDMNEL